MSNEKTLYFVIDWFEQRVKQVFEASCDEAALEMASLHYVLGKKLMLVKEVRKKVTK